MATCRECLHYDACKMFYITILPKAPLLTDGVCDNFTPKSDYVKRERGEWIFDENNVFYCSVCKKCPPLMRQTNFCPNCSADMRKEENNA